jgi:hypothetical protein
LRFSISLLNSSFISCAVFFISYISTYSLLCSLWSLLHSSLSSYHYFRVFSRFLFLIFHEFILYILFNHLLQLLLEYLNKLIHDFLFEKFLWISLSSFVNLL